MKAVIMAGGEGKRLRPVTGALPKPLAPLLGRPMIEHIVLLLKKHGFTDICVTLGYRAEDIANALGDGSALGVNISCCTESKALGTAGGVKNCAAFYGGGDFLVISGDAACDIDLTALWQAHRETGAAATLALCRSAEPLGFGLAVTDGEGFVRSFIEKPRWERVVSDLVNTGIYILSPRAMEAVPEGVSFDFAKDLFPLLLQRGEKLLGVPADGYWCDAGTPLAYYRCCVDALEGRLKLDAAESFRQSPPEEQPQRGERWQQAVICPCRSRAALMGALSRELMELGADYSDGLRLHGRSYELRIAPEALRSAVGVYVSAGDAEFARELAVSARDMIAALEL